MFKRRGEVLVDMDDVVVGRYRWRRQKAGDAAPGKARHNYLALEREPRLRLVRAVGLTHEFLELESFRELW